MRGVPADPYIDWEGRVTDMETLDLNCVTSKESSLPKLPGIPLTSTGYLGLLLSLAPGFWSPCLGRQVFYPDWPIVRVQTGFFSMPQEYSKRGSSV